MKCVCTSSRGVGDRRGIYIQLRFARSAKTTFAFSENYSATSEQCLHIKLTRTISPLLRMLTWAKLCVQRQASTTKRPTRTQPRTQTARQMVWWSPNRQEDLGQVLRRRAIVRERTLHTAVVVKDIKARHRTARTLSSYTQRNPACLDQAKRRQTDVRGAGDLQGRSKDCHAKL